MKCVKICPFAAFCLKVMSFWLWTNLPEGKQPCHPSLEWVNKSSLNILKQINNKMITGGIVSRFKKHQRHYFRFPCSFPLACSFWDRNWENEETVNDWKRGGHSSGCFRPQQSVCCLLLLQSGQDGELCWVIWCSTSGQRSCSLRGRTTADNFSR